jgi:hypothetical protein
VTVRATDTVRSDTAAETERARAAAYEALIASYAGATRRYDEAPPEARRVLAGEAARAAWALHEYFLRWGGDLFVQPAWAYIAERWEARQHQPPPAPRPSPRWRMP